MSVSKLLETFATYIKFNLNGDGFPPGASLEADHFSPYPYMSVPVGSPDQKFANMVPWMTGVSQFVDPSFQISGGTLAAGGLVVTKVGAFTNYEFVPGDIFKVISGTGATGGLYLIASKISNDQIALATSAGQGGGPSNLSSSIIRKDNDPVIVTGAYNLTGTNTQQIITEPSAGVYLETNYLMPGYQFMRNMEWYLSFRAPNNTNEIRPLNFNYDPVNDEISEATIRVKSTYYGGTLDLARSEIDHSVFARIGPSSINFYGYDGSNTIMSISAPSAHVSQLSLGANGVDGAFIVQATNESRIDMSVAGRNFLTVVKGSNSALLSINANINTNALDVTAPDVGWGGSAIVARAKAGNNEPVFEIRDSANRSLHSRSTAGVPNDIVTSVTAVGSSVDDAAVLTGAVNNISSAGAGRGVKLNYAVGDLVEGYNASPIPVIVYAENGATINSTNTSFTVASHKSFRARKMTEFNWAVTIGP